VITFGWCAGASRLRERVFAQLLEPVHRARSHRHSEASCTWRCRCSPTPTRRESRPCDRLIVRHGPRRCIGHRLGGWLVTLVGWRNVFFLYRPGLLASAAARDDRADALAGNAGQATIRAAHRHRRAARRAPSGRVFSGMISGAAAAGSRAPPTSARPRFDVGETGVVSHRPACRSGREPGRRTLW